MDMKESFEKAIKNTQSAGKSAGFGKGAGLVALNLAAKLKEHGAIFNDDLGQDFDR